jgi:hypothetical protein
MSFSTFLNSVYAALLRLAGPAITLWRVLRNLGLVLKPIRFSLLMVAVGMLFLFWADQGLDTLRNFAEHAGGRYGVSQALAFALGGFLWAFGSWYWARVMSYVRVGELPEKKRWVSFLQTWLPRAIGLAAILGIALALWLAAAPYSDHRHGPGLVLSLYAGGALAGALVFAVFVVTRRALVKRLAPRLKRRAALAPVGTYLARVKPARRQAYGTQKLADTLRAAAPMFVFTLATAFALALAFFIAPEATAPAIGSAPILLLAAAGWIALGSAADLFGMLAKLPVFTVLFIAAFLFSFVNDNHAVRTLDAPPPPAWAQRPNLEQALKDWQKQQLERPLPRRDDIYPLFLVAAEGGGIRAAYWTATVLGELQDRNPCFADQLFALSGVSGGSLGSTVFAALLAQQQYGTPNLRCGGPRLDVKDTAQKILGEDFLAPALAATLYPDLFQRVWPWPVAHFDRARALELSWERAWRRHVGGDRLHAPFDQLWSDQQVNWQPALLLNATRVETGRRLIVSNLRLTPEEFNDVEDAHRFLGARALPLSAAVHLSARFTYVSPAGTLMDGERVYGRAVDGGYFENSGTTAVLEILQAVDQLQASGDGFWKQVRPVVILIRNEPVRQDAEYDELPDAKPLACCNEVLSPLLALLHTRGARGAYARETASWHIGRSSFLRFGLCENETMKIPLGWTLSQAVRDVMEQQLQANRCRAYPNLTNLEKIDALLAPRARR